MSKICPQKDDIDLSNVSYRTKQFDEIKFGKNVKILIILHVWQIKFSSKIG